MLESTDILWVWVRIFAGLSLVIEHSCWKVWLFSEHLHHPQLMLESVDFYLYLFLVDMGMYSCSSLSHYPELMLKSVDVLLT